MVGRGARAEHGRGGREAEQGGGQVRWGLVKAKAGQCWAGRGVCGHGRVVWKGGPGRCGGVKCGHGRGGEYGYGSMILWI